MDVDCSSVLGITMITGADACAGARAAIRAAEVQAKATRHAATIGLMTGLGAVFAGLMAYRAAVQQAKQVQDQQTARQRAYARQVMTIIDNAKHGLRVLRDLAKEVISIDDYEKHTEDFSSEGDKNIRKAEIIKRKLDVMEEFRAILSSRLTSIDIFKNEMDPKNWERHSLLVGKSSEKIVPMYRSLVDFEESLKELSDMFNKNFHVGWYDPSQKEVNVVEFVEKVRKVRSISENIINQSLDLFDVVERDHSIKTMLWRYDRFLYGVDDRE